MMHNKIEEQANDVYKSIFTSGYATSPIYHYNINFTILLK